MGGAKGKGLKRKKQFEKVALDKGITPAQFKKVCTTRFRLFRIALKPVLSNWHAIVAYYRTVKKLTDRQIKLKPVLSNWHAIVAYYRTAKKLTDRQIKLKPVLSNWHAIVAYYRTVKKLTDRQIKLKPVLSNWHAIVAYYRTVKKLTDRQIKLKEYFVGQEFMSKLKLNFIWAASKDCMDGLDFFEKRGEEIHDAVIQDQKTSTVSSCRQVG